VGQIKNIGSIEDQPILTTNEWEEVKKKGEAGIKKWIDDNMSGKSCQIVLVGANTYGRKWVNYEIEKAWADKKGLLAIHIHNMKDSSGNQSTKGKNPYAYFTVGSDKKPMTNWVKTVDPPYTDSQKVYDHIKNNIEDWVEDAISLR
jgi:hypothetical protein